MTAAFDGPLGAAFERAVDLILGTGGRVIVSGIGKSGHVGRKLAATLASTGTHAFFVHPTEASHGDLGMIARDDVILALSWSGETAETLRPRRLLPALLDSAHRGDAQRREHARQGGRRGLLELPRVRESCPHDLARPRRA